MPLLCRYAIKSRVWSLTDGFRGELQTQGTQVLGVHTGPIYVDMGSGVDYGPLTKASPGHVVRQVLNALEAGEDEVLVDEITRQVC